MLPSLYRMVVETSVIMERILRESPKITQVEAFKQAKAEWEKKNES